MPNKCGECAEWPNTIPGRKLLRGDWEHACLKGGKLVSKNTPADGFCFSRRVDVSERRRTQTRVRLALSF